MSPIKFSFEKDEISHIRESTTRTSFPLHTHDLKILLGDSSRSRTNILRLVHKLGIDPSREIKGFRGGREFSDEQILTIARAGSCQIVDDPQFPNIYILGPTGAKAVIPRKSS
ncbi:MAG: hypothetical protein WAV41_01390 [Microgenomates group bacterium]